MYKIIIIDDEPLARLGLAAFIGTCNQSVTLTGSYENGQEALEAMNLELPDIVITDIRMPLMNGMEFLEVCHQKFSTLPAFIVTTSYENFEYARFSVKYASSYLLKMELTQETLNEAIKHAINKLPPKADYIEQALPIQKSFQTQFFSKLLTQDFFSEREISNIISNPELVFFASYYIPITLQLRTSYKSESNTFFSQYENIVKLIQTSLNINEKYVLVTINLHEIVLIVSLNNLDNYTKIFLSKFQLLQTLSIQYFEIPITYVIGEPVSNLTNLRTSFLKSKETLAPSSSCQPQLKLVQSAKSYIHKHIEEKLSLQTVSAAINVSPSYLSMLFKTYSNEGFSYYVNQSKIEEAKRLLSQTDMKIYEISDKLGFDNSHYFSTVYKKHTGRSPSERSSE